MLRLLGLFLGLFLVAADVSGQPARKGPRGGDGPRRAADAMPITGLSPAKAAPNLCVYSYRVSTRSPECQVFCDQALGYFYSYVWMEAARNFETALKHDPDCAYAWLGLSRSLEKWGRGIKPPSPIPFAAVLGGSRYIKLPEALVKSPVEAALDNAKLLMSKSNPREQLLIRARLQEKGTWPNTGPDERKKKAQASLDELLTLYDDEEGWFWRAQLAEGTNGAVPFYKALLRLNPLHPGANHELVHFYEGATRPGLGWPYAEAYMKSSPALPHAFHMQAHLATRIGKWEHTSDWSAQAIEMEKAYHKVLNVRPGDDHQFSHHLETLTRGLVHDGRFAEARQVKAEISGLGYTYRPEWIRMALVQKDWVEAGKLIDPLRRTDKANAAYYGALLALEQGGTTRAGTEVDTLRQAQQTKKADKTLETKLWEVQGRYLCQTGQGDAGLKLLKRAVDKTKDSYSHHAWGNGARLMEAWGVGALEAGNAAEAAEAFQEALAHDTGSVRGALGMWAVCDRLGQTEEAGRFAKVARRCWAKAESKDFERLKADFAEKALKLPRPTTSAAAEGE